MIRPGCVLAGAVAVAAACQPGTRSSGDGSSAPAESALSAPHKALVAELRRIQERSTRIDPLPVHVEQIEFAEASSAAVPGLRYYRAMYRPPEVSHGFFSIVAGERSGRVEIIRDALDWGVLTRGWRPADQADAIAACQELISALSSGREMPTPANRIAQDRTWLSMWEPFLASRMYERLKATLAAPAVAAHKSGYANWEVTMWAAHLSPAAVFHYRCTLPATPQAGPGFTALQVIDSLTTGFPDPPL